MRAVEKTVAISDHVLLLSEVRSLKYPVVFNW